MNDLPSYSSKDWALDLHDHGYQVVVVPLRGKRPLISWKRFQTERVPRDLVEEWFAQGEHNIALISGTISGTVVVDGDSPDACTYIEETCTPTMKVLTSKGAHYYYRHPGGKVPNSARILDDPPIDIRGDGGLTIGPGSLHKSGSFYQMAEGQDLVSTQNLPPFNREWFDIKDIKEVSFVRPILSFAGPVQKDAYEQATHYMAKVPGASQGGRDSECYVQACRLVRGFCLPENQALDLLRVWNQSCIPPLGDGEVAAKIKHAQMYGNGPFGSMLAKASARTVGGLMIEAW